MLDAIEVLKKLVKFNTIKDKENKEILDYIESNLKSIGFKTEKRDKFLIMYNNENTSLGFLGHTDTVDSTPNWKYDPFTLTQVQDKLYGLGACDMKAGIAGIISALSKIDLESFNKGIKLYFTYDEEIGFSGIKEVVEYENNFPKTMIIGEPTNNEIMVGSKGLMEYKISFKGISTHSSTPDKGKNAIMDAMKFISRLNDFYENELKQIENSNFEIAYTTMNVGTISGGTGINCVPEYCEFLVDFRTTDKIIENEIINKLNELKEDYDCKIEELNKLSAFFNKQGNLNKTCNYITEASFIEGERLILGAGPVTAHEVNEYITVDSLYKLVDQYEELIKKYLSN